MAETLADVTCKVAVANLVLWGMGLATGVTASLEPFDAIGVTRVPYIRNRHTAVT